MMKCAVAWVCVLRKSLPLLVMLMAAVSGSGGFAQAETGGGASHLALAAASPVTVTLSSAAGDPIITPFEVAAQFGTPVTGLRSDQLQVVNATVASFSAIPTQSLAAGSMHSLVVRSDGTVAAWGSNNYGQCAVPVGLSGVWCVAAGGTHSLALKADGTVAAWGNNTDGQCTVPAGLGRVVAIAAGKNHSLALKADGTVTAWGSNAYGQCKVPAGLTQVVAITAGDYHNLAIKADGTLVAWGDNTKGICTPPANLGRVKAVAAGNIHSVAVRTDGTVVAWGLSTFGNLNMPAGLGNVVAIAASGYHNLALKGDGTVVAWGDNSAGASNVPAGLGGVTAIAAGGQHSLALKADGTVVAWGMNSSGQGTIPAGVTGRQPAILGYRFVMQPLAPGVVSVQVPASVTTSLDGRPNQASNLLTRHYVSPGTLRVAIKPAAAVTVGAKWRRVGSSAWRDSGTTEGMLMPGNYPVEFKDTALGGWKSPAGQVATISAGTTTTLTVVYEALPVTATLTRFVSDPTTASLHVMAEFSQPVTGLTSASLKVTNATASHVRGISTYATMAADGYNRLAIRPDGTVAAWGVNQYNECNVPAGLKGVVALSAQGGHCLALMSDGTVAAWGNNDAGQCDLPTNLTGVVAIAAGGHHNLALKADGTVVDWGRGVGSSVPANLDGVVAIAAGFFHSLALKADGTVVAWGYNEYHQCEVPVGLGPVVAIAAGTEYSAALKADGKVVVWGDDENGQCDVPAGLCDVVAISAGVTHMLALRANGSLVAWGGLNPNSPGSYTVEPTIPAGLGAVTAIAAGSYDSLVLRSDGTLASFPGNSYPSTNIPAGLAVRPPAFSRACFDLTPLAPGLATAQVPAGAVSGLGGTPNQASNLLQYEFLAPGGLQVNLAPEAAVAWGAQWRRAGSARWLDSGTSQTYYFPGTYPLEFRGIDLTGWGRPTVTSATIPSGARTTLPVHYEALPVTVTLTTDVSGPALTSMTVRAAFSRPVSGITASKLALSNARVSAIRWGAALPTLAIGGSHCLALEPDGTVRGWGDNTDGLANVPEDLRGVVAVACGAYHNLALRVDGTVAIWGTNGFGQLAMPTGLTDVVAIAAGGTHSLALKADGTVVAWGDNSYRQCNVPAGLNSVVAIAAGASHSLALKADGTVVAWGNGFGSNVPAGLTNVVALAASGANSMALRADGTVVVWGDTYHHQCEIPAGLDDVISIGTSPAVCFAVKKDGTVVAWGDKTYYDLVNVPTGLSGVVTVVGGSYAALALKSDGSVVCWGTNFNGTCTPPAGLVVGQPPLNQCAFTLTPQATGAVSVQAAVGAGLTLGGVASQPSNLLQRDLVLPGAIEATLEPPEVLAQGAQWRRAGSTAWLDSGTSDSNLKPRQYTVEFKDLGLRGWKRPDNQDVMVGIGETARVTARYEAQPVTVTLSTLAGDPALSPIAVTADFSVPVAGFKASQLAATNATIVNLRCLTAQWPIAAGNYHSLALRTDGTVAFWGDTSWSQNANMPANLHGAVALAAGDYHSLALLADGTVAAWGGNTYGQCNVPAGLGGVVAIAAGNNHSLALKADGTVVSWGYIGSAPAGLGGVVAIAAGASHCLALKADGTVVAWGDTSNRRCEVPAGLSGVVAISAGYSHSLALKADGTVVIWGADGKFTVPAGLGGVQAIAANNYANAALKADGTMVIWDNQTGELSSEPASLTDVVAITAGRARFLALKADGTVVMLGISGGILGSVPAGLVARQPAGTRFRFDLAQPASGQVSVQLPAGVVASLGGIANLASNILQRNGILAGSLAVTLNPAGAVAAGAGWRRVGTTAWRDGGSTETGLMPGAASVEFKGLGLSGWQRPAPVSATIASDETTRLTAQYESSPVTVTLSSTASNPVNAPFDIAADFSVPVTGFNAAKVIAANGRVLRTCGVTAQASLAAGAYHCLALRGDGVPVGWGSNGSRQGEIPAELNDVVAVASGADFNLALRSDGTVAAWGDNTSGQCNVPAGLTGVRAIAAGSAHCLALRLDGTVVAWGANYMNQCAVPTGLNGVVAVAAGRYHNLALRADGTVIAWGGAGIGECDVPAGLKAVVAIAAGSYYSLALKADGTVAAWGTNSIGQCNVPAGLTTVRAIAAGASHSLALKADGTVVAWGSNNSGQCTVPAGLGGVTAIAAGADHSMALKADGSVVVWGMNSYGLQTLPAGLTIRQPAFTRYQFQVAPQAEGTVSVQTLAGAAQSLAGVASQDSNTLQRNMVTRGSLAVTLEPAEAVAAGAQWHRKGMTAWLDSGTSESGLTMGTYGVEFKPVGNWTAPSPQTVTISGGEVTAVTGRYVRQTGTVQVQVTPTTATWTFLDGDGKAHSGMGNASLGGIPTGNIVMTWSPQAGYDPPTGGLKPLAQSATVLFSGVYTRQTGNLAVTLSPAQAVTAGAQWRRLHTTLWRDSAAGETALPTGNYTVEFKPLTGWTTPGNKVVTISSGQTAQATGAYVRQTGTVQVQVTPTTATWSFLDGDGKAHSGKGNASLGGIPTGNIVMIWSPQAGYDPPTGGLKPLAQSATVLFSGVYARQTGNLAVTLSPAKAVDAGAKWRRTGTLLWRDSAVNETALPTGNYTVEFKPTAGWTTPVTKVVTVSKGQTAQATGAYIRQTGSLKVTITPAAAVSAGAQWHRAGTSTWLASGSTEKSVPTGDYTIEFKAVAGWKAPANVNVIVNNGQTVQLSRIYRDIRNAVPGGAWRLYGQ